MDIDNCSIKKSSQCHIVAGIMSNGHVPMKTLTGFRAGPAMAEVRFIRLRSPCDKKVPNSVRNKLFNIHY